MTLEGENELMMLVESDDDCSYANNEPYLFLFKHLEAAEWMEMLSQHADLSFSG